MIIEEKDITPQPEAKPRKNRRGLKILFGIIVAIFVSSVIISFVFDEEESKPKSQTAATKKKAAENLLGFEAVPFNSKKAYALRIMKENGWTQMDDFNTNGDDVPISTTVSFKKEGYRFQGNESLGVRLSFSEETDTLVAFAVSFDFTEMDKKRYEKIVKACLAVSDFNILVGQDKTPQGGKIYAYKNSYGMSCVYWLQKYKTSTELWFSYSPFL